MITRSAALALALVLGCACTDAGPSPDASPNEEARVSYAPVYFIDGPALVPEFIELAEGEPVEQLFAALVTGPTRGSWRTALTESMQLRGEFERAETLQLDPGDEFWDGPTELVKQRAAQIVYTMASLEEGRQVRLLFLGAPSRQPLRKLFGHTVGREDLAGVFDASIQVVAPVPGSLVSTRFPVRVALVGIDKARVVIEDVDGTVLAQALLRDGEALIHLPADTPDQLELRIEATNGNHLHPVGYPLRFVAP